ncbi:cation diffusion facilitator CzcD-associated flavoprotein CzcO [Streptosporangium album]|uniref:Cation diffusion facilitator CzcD-associated flavoprotein CzcO n=1 Tax=Streptosporangium album TaxID=47479 RepID=A0A7W7RV46_9ACTN|nr:FAD-dependent oxidoreductase [Streptosporangium album]MBB4938814.1 cation diffusion facilitator CzcD-associated flavoprotein CzcO [Streptosporangium album]
MAEIDVVVIGAGQAGLSSAYFLSRAGLDFVVLDRSPRPGGAWQFRWPSLTLGATHRVHDLPGLPMGVADTTRPSSEVVSEYFAAYERTFDLPMRRPVAVRAVREGEGGRLLVETTAGDWSARALVNATGTWDRPFWPRYPGQETFLGRQLHTADYVTREEFAGRHVVVVGAGASAVQLLMEIAEITTTTWVTRRPPVFREGPFDEGAARAAVARVDARVRAGLPPGSVVGATGYPMTPQVRAAMAAGVLDRLPMFDRIVPEGVVWDDAVGQRRLVTADVILWATGFRPVVTHLAPLRLREPGGGIRVEDTRAVLDPRVHLVGYGPSASTIGANRAGRTAVQHIRRLLGEPVAA